MNTGERLMRVETKMENIEVKLDAQAKRNREDFQLVFDKIDGLRSRFAGKWVEKLVLGIVVALAVGITGLIMTGAIG